jgi:predicted NBD/HSP70 family sugar kinase
VTRGPAASTEAVLRLLLRHGELTRPQLARRTRLSAATVSATVARLVSTGLVVERGHGPHVSATQRGRPSTLLSLNPSAGAVIGVDFGHRYLRVVVVDLAHEVLAETLQPLETGNNASLGLATVADLVPRLLHESGCPPASVLGVGVGLPAPVGPGGKIAMASILPTWTGSVPAADLAALLGFDTWVDNDVNLAALAEATWGASRGIATSAYVSLETGIGAGLLIDGRPFRGAFGVAGEFGHVKVVRGGVVCRCGSRGCLETVAGMEALVGSLRALHGPDFDAAGLLALAAAGDSGCQRVITDAGREIGEALANLLNIFNPEIVVVGGALAGAGDLLLEPIRAAVASNAIAPVSESTTITAGVMGSRAGALGGAALVLQNASSTFAAAYAGDEPRDLATGPRVPEDWNDVQSLTLSPRSEHPDPRQLLHTRPD